MDITCNPGVYGSVNAISNGVAIKSYTRMTMPIKSQASLHQSSSISSSSLSALLAQQAFGHYDSTNGNPSDKDTSIPDRVVHSHE
eukprot:4187804-Amphidinium_carterae.1